MSLTERVQAGERIDDLLIIDAHMHLNEPPFYVPATDAQACLTTMDKYGIALGISAPQLAITCDMRQGNDEILNIAAEEERLKAYCSISPHFPDEIADEMQRCRDAGAIGIKIHPSIHQVAITDARYDAVFDFAQEYGLPVLSHTWEGNPLCSPLKVSEIIERNPELKIIVGHSGGTFSGMRETIEVI